MAWTSDPWIQDDSVNFGFPYTLEPAPQADLLNSKTIWTMNSDINFGFPYMLESTPEADLSELKTIWNFHPAVNFGFPYIVTLEELPEREKPVFSAFSVSGMGAGFHQQNQKIPLHFTDTAAFQFKMPDALHFYFPDMKEVSL